MKAMLVSTASSWGVRASGMRETAPTVPWIVSRRVRPVKTRVVMFFSASLRVAQDCTSLDSGTFSGSQKLPVRRSQTSRSFSSWTLFQLIPSTTPSLFHFDDGVDMGSFLLFSRPRKAPTQGRRRMPGQ